MLCEKLKKHLCHYVSNTFQIEWLIIFKFDLCVVGAYQTVLFQFDAWSMFLNP